MNGELTLADLQRVSAMLKNAPPPKAGTVLVEGGMIAIVSPEGEKVFVRANKSETVPFKRFRGRR